MHIKKNKIIKYKGHFARRTAICFFVMCLLFLTCVLRVAVITSGSYKEAQTSQSSYRITVSRMRGTVYDTNMLPLTNNKKEKYCAIAPTPDGIVNACQILRGDTLEEALSTLKQNKPYVCKIKGSAKSESIAETYVYKTEADDFVAEHIIGYCDSDGHGVTGIEKAYDDILYSKENVDAVFNLNGKGEILKGVKPEFSGDLAEVQKGVVTTLDVNICNIVKNASKSLTKGAVIICEAKSGKIRAMISKPHYNKEKIELSLNAADSPLFNRAVNAYNVGSVFKPCVAAAAIENGFLQFSYDCTGKVNIDNRDYFCHKRDGHGGMDLINAIKNSCNAYFYNLGINLGAESVRKTAQRLNFGTDFNIGKNLTVNGGNLTELSHLNSNGLLANFAIGQGELLLSPVSLLTLYSAIATDGSYFVPSIIEKTLLDGRETKYNKGAKTKAMEKSTADTLKIALREVVLSGTGEAANISEVSLAGKTATAQTGRYDENGNEITNSFFCGFFPYEKPKYVGVVFADGQNNCSTAEIFGEIAKNMQNYY